MHLEPKDFDPRQEMHSPDFELQYKRDSYLKDVDLHHHDFFELYYLVSGDVTYIIESRLYHLRPGDMLLISPRELHQVCIRPEMAVYERFVLWIDPKTIQALSTASTDLGRCLDPGCPGYGNLLKLCTEDQLRIRAWMEQLYRETLTPDFGSALLQQSLITQLLVTINRLVTHAPASVEEEAPTEQFVSQIIDYINLHYHEPLSLDMLADRFFVSKYHLSHEFNRQIGTSLYRYIQKKRLMIARQLLSQGKKPNEVYSMCGFGDYTCFYRAFRAEYGIAPKEYARSVRREYP